MPQKRLPKEWSRFAKQYGASLSYWYVPKGLAVSAESIKPRLRVLKEFEHSGQWRSCQRKYIERLVDLDISGASIDWEEGGVPLARMLKKVFVTLGLAWVDPNDQIEITPAGEKFLASSDPDSVLSDQLSRYQFWNPGVKSKDHINIELHPVPFLIDILTNLDDHYISGDEYTLFVSRANSYSDVDRTIELIESYRSTPPDLQSMIKQYCGRYKIAGTTRRDSVYNTVRLNRSYAVKMWSLSKYIDLGNNSSLRLNVENRRGARSILRDYARSGIFIDFQSEKDWISYFGNPVAMPSVETAVDYYVNVGDVASAVAAKKRTNATANDIKVFEEAMVSEKSLEDYLEKDLDAVGKKINSSLTLIGRQYSTPVGPIDLLAKDKKTGQYVVIELKKGRSADRVFGQCSRYMGWVKKNLSKDNDVVGVIVARSIDRKLRAARDAHQTAVHLIEFEM